MKEVEDWKQRYNMLAKNTDPKAGKIIEDL